MAKRDEFPQNVHIVPRLECILRSHSQLSNLLRTVENHVLPYLGEEFPATKILIQQIEDAKLARDLAVDAMSGESSE